MLREIRVFVLWLGLLVVPCTLQAQFFPVQATTQLLPPYSVYLSDYASEGIDKLRVILVQGDFTQPTYQLRLMMSIEYNGRIIMRTSRSFTPVPISITPGVPTVISGALIAPYLDSRHIDFVGYSREEYERTRALPEGGYRIIFTAYDYARQDVQVSNVASAFYYLAKNEPPLINFPSCGTQVRVNTPQQIVFSWLPRNTASPMSVLETQYEFSLYEMRPATRNPNDAVLTTAPVYQVTTDLTQLVFGLAEPMLIPDLNYAWRVRAIDRNGRDAFRNNGYSEVCTFKYGGLDPGIVLTPVAGVLAVGETERRGKVTWTATSLYEGYRIQYKKKGFGFEWFKEDADQGELKIFNLEPSVEYEVRVQGKKSEVFGPYSDIVSFRTKAHVEAQCGTAPAATTKNFDKPLASANVGLVIDARGLDLELSEITALSEKGWYKGGGVCKIPYLGTAAFHVKFDRIFISEDREVVSGRIDLITKGINGMVENQIRDQQRKEREKKQRENREQWAGTVFYERVFLYNVDIEEVVATDDYVNIIDNTGKITASPDIATKLKDSPENAIIIQDKNGDQWVAQKDPVTGKNKVTKVEAGGLSPADNAPLSSESEDFLKRVLTLLQKQYNDIRHFETEYNKKKKIADDYAQKILEESLKSTGVGNTTTNEFNNVPSEEDDLMFFSVEEGTNDDPVFKELKEAESALNLAKMVKLLTQAKSPEDHRIIFSGLTIQGKGASEFIADRKKSGATADTIAQEMKEALLGLMSNILERNQ